MKLSAATLLIVIGAFACQGQHLHESPELGDRVESIVLEGDALASELAESPVREATIPFVRLGMFWDADAPETIEVSTSVDGATWSDWAAPNIYHVEMEETGNFVGEYQVPSDEPALFYRLRTGNQGAPSFLSAEFMEFTLSESIEDGEVFDPLEPTTYAIDIGGASVNSRSSWGAKAPKCVTNHSPNRLTIHHTVTPTNDSSSPQARLRSIQSFHQNSRGWCDIGYQYLISRDGRLWEGRGASRLGSHVAGKNTGNVGISFLGTHDSTPATTTQVKSVATLVRGLADRYGIALNRTKVKGHREQGSTTCPGSALYAQLGTIVQTAKDGGEQPPPPGTTTVKGVVFEGNDTSARIAGATVKLGSLTATTNSIGYFEFANVDADSVSVSATASGFQPGGVTRATTGEVTWASVSLTKVVGNAGLQGVVYRGSNSSNRVPNATITVSGGVVTQTDANGYYTVEGLAPGPYTITATSNGDSGSTSRTAVSNQLTWASVRL